MRIDGKHHLEFELLRSDYEDMIAGLLDKTMVGLHQALNDAGIAPRDISKVMLVGGATRTPLVRRMLEKRMHLDPCFEIDPDLIVAMGAGQFGLLKAGSREAGPESGAVALCVGIAGTVPAPDALAAKDPRRVHTTRPRRPLKPSISSRPR